MPRSQKDILCIISSSDIYNIDFDKYLSADIGQVIYDDGSPIAADIRKWAWNNKIESVPWKLNSDLLDYPELEISMVNFCDKVALFWSEKPDRVAAVGNYILENDIGYILHIIKE